MRDIFAIVVMAVIGIGLAIAAWAHITERLEARTKRKAHGDGSRDTASCDHDWIVSESGTCIPSYSSVGADPQVAWHKYRCRHCGETRFECDSLCPQYETCDTEGFPPQTVRKRRALMGYSPSGTSA